MAKLKSSLTNMLLSLTLIALVAAGLLAAVYSVTEEPINKAKAEKQAAAKLAVLPEIENLVIAEEPEIINEKTTVYKVYSGDQLVAAAVETQENGFGGVFKMMVGFDKEGNITGYQVLEHQETPGLGSKMDEWFKTEKNSQNIVGRNPEVGGFIVSKDNGDVDAITAATISSRAFLLAVTNADSASQKVFGAVAEVQGISGATTMQEEIVVEETIENQED